MTRLWALPGDRARRRGPRRAVVVTLLVGAAVPLAGSVAVARSTGAPAVARAADAPVALGRYTTTVVAASERNDGIIGLSGGLAPLDTAGAKVSLTLDNGPSAHAVGVPVEPGTLARTGVGQVNTSAGSQVAAVPQAEAQLPGGETTGTTSGAGTGTAAVTETSATATADGAAPAVAGAGALGAGHAAGSTSFDAVTQTLVATGDAAAASTTFGPLTVGAVSGTASVTYRGGKHTSTAQTVVGASTVAGMPVTIDDTGIHAAGQSAPLPGTDPVASALAAAGVTAVLRPPALTADDGDASADSGGLEVTVVTPDTEGYPGNTVSTYLGKVSVTVLDGLATPDFPIDLSPVTDEVPDDDTGADEGLATTEGSVGTPGTLAVPGTPGSPGAVTPKAPATAAPVAARARGLVLAGRKISPTTALAGLGAWQLITLAIVTGVTLIGRGTPEEHLCPCDEHPAGGPA